MRILLVEDDFNLAETLAEAITDQRYVVDVASDGESALDYIKALDYDLLLLDVMLPDFNGIDLCQQLRSQGYQMPILMITALDTVSDKIMGLDAGADDYIIKPVDLGELFARIRALLRRGSSTPPILEWGNLQFDPSTYEVSYSNHTIHLTPKEYSLLELLLRNGRKVLSRHAIIDSVWSLEDPPEEDTVKFHIRSLRKKLKAAGAADDFIETVHGVGYRLIKIDS
ncbi:MAG: response regulator transcription factor [Xenococcaceae cyanobacterium MO_188.B19]|nr:response regulator transcription factor [Xenococcaceae cyanobacterium MO_188.B19]